MTHGEGRHFTLSPPWDMRIVSALTAGLLLTMDYSAPHTLLVLALHAACIVLKACDVQRAFIVSPVSMIQWTAV